MASQSRVSSLNEQLLNVGTGFFISLIYWQLAIIPQIEGKELVPLLNLSITAQFTVISVARGYVFRRLFNYYLTKVGEEV